MEHTSSEVMSFAHMSSGIFLLCVAAVASIQLYGRKGARVAAGLVTMILIAQHVAAGDIEEVLGIYIVLFLAFAVVVAHLGLERQKRKELGL